MDSKDERPNERDTTPVRLPKYIIAKVLKHEMTNWEKENRQTDHPSKYVARYLKKMLGITDPDDESEEGMTVQDMLK